MRYTHPALLDHLASAYVLGTLGGGARRRFERLLRDRGDVQLLVAQWEGRLGMLARSVPVQQPPQRVWAAIEARTRPRDVKDAAPQGGWAGVLWRRHGVLQGLAGVVLGVVATVALVAAVPTLFVSSDQVALRAGDKLPQAYVGLLTDEAGNGKVLVSSLRHGRTLTVKVIGPITLPAMPATSATMAGAAPQLVLWAVPADGAPFVLGTVPVAGSAVSVLPDTSEKLLLKVSKLMVTLETSATPQVPSNTVLFTGNCAKLW
ncbi:anti-sigma factor domain-containing protein [Acidovorax sp. ACV01]|uniref:anti-sigma factor n=1 Tax=Acidovorax sp. ACV01 TaxID=2769311 RepID=UPI00177FBF15|nr:anti-sigma factor [Acidovorax sp. ACV01]MBD9392085.1 anti-sigma factor [Acidovorax sp. ACV01]